MSLALSPEPRAATSSRWGIIAAFAMVAAVTQLLWVTYTPITTEAAAFYHVSDSAAGWLSEVFPLLYVLLAIPCGMLTDRWFRGSLAVGAILTAFGGLIRVAPTFDAALFGQIIISVGQPLVVNAINKAAAVYVAEKQRPTAIAVGSASLFGGILIAMLSGPILLSASGMSAVLWSQALFAVVGTLWLLWALRTRPVYSAPADVQSSISRVWKDSLIRTLSGLLFIGFGLFIAVTTWLQVLLAKDGVTSLEVGIALAVMTAAGIVGAGIVPPWAIKHGRSRHVVVASLAVSVVALVAIGFGRPFWLIAGLLAVTGFLLLADLPILLSITEIHAAPSDVGTASGLLLLFGNLGGIVLALLVQVFVNHSLVAVGILVIGSAIAAPLTRRIP